MVVIIDNYDSFTYNLVDYIGQIYGGEIRILRNNKCTVSDIQQLSPNFIIISPGPKNPKEAGISKDVIDYFKSKCPILGVCLGHQAIGEVFGAKVVIANNMMHGKVSEIRHSGDQIFNGVNSKFKATRYHSLVIDRQSLTTDLVPLAFSEDDNEIMAIRHLVYPIYGLQFHPESILTTQGLTMIKNFFKIKGEK